MSGSISEIKADRSNRVTARFPFPAYASNWPTSAAALRLDRSAVSSSGRAASSRGGSIDIARLTLPRMLVSRLFEIVRDAAGQNADAFQLLRLLQGFRVTPLLRHIVKQSSILAGIPLPQPRVWK